MISINTQKRVSCGGGSIDICEVRLRVMASEIRLRLRGISVRFDIYEGEKKGSIESRGSIETSEIILIFFY